MEVGDRDLLNPNVMRDDMHDWVVANEDMAKVLAARGYHYQFVFARNAGHTDRTVKATDLARGSGVCLARLPEPLAALTVRRLEENRDRRPAACRFRNLRRLSWTG